MQGGSNSMTTDPATGFEVKVCRTCRQVKPVDSLGYCTACYPYGEACDRYKERLEQKMVDGLIVTGRGRL